MERVPRSHSQLSNYLHCSHAYYLQKVKRVPEGPSVWLPGGKAFHTAGEAHNRATWAERKEPNGSLAWLHEPAPFIDIFDTEFERHLDELRENDPDESTWRTAGRSTIAKPNGEDIAWWREAGRKMVTDFVAWRAAVEDTLVVATVHGEAAVELKVDSPLGGVPIVGYIDVVYEDAANGRLLITDLKTGSRPPASPMQLAGYSVQLEDDIGRPVRWGAYYDARKGVLTQPVDLSAWTEAKLGRAYQNLDRGITEGVFLPRIDSHCKACGVRRACVYTGGIEPA